MEYEVPFLMSEVHFAVLELQSPADPPTFSQEYSSNTQTARTSRRRQPTNNMAGRNSGGRSTTSTYPCASSASSNIVERCWEVQPPGSVPKAGLVIIHGGSWHSGWFGEMGDLLSSPEYFIRVSAPDLPGHGLSDDTVPGYRCRERNLSCVETPFAEERSVKSLGSNI